MSLDATRWAWQQDLRPSHKLLLLSLADRAGEDHECYPSVARLQGDTGLHRETIMEAITHLEQVGLIAVDRKNGSGNRYRLLGVLNRHEDQEKPIKPVRKTIQVDESNQSEKPVRKTSTENRTAFPDQYGKPYCNQYGKPDSESTNESKNKKTVVSPPPENLNFEAWKKWVEYRKEIKKTIREISIPSAQKALANFGDLQAEVVEQSIANGWQGLFELKNAATKTAESEKWWDT